MLGTVSTTNGCLVHEKVQPITTVYGLIVPGEGASYGEGSTIKKT
jgi:hypothetical protein